MLTRSARELRVAASELDALDATIGDGDLGSSLAALFEGSVDEVDTAKASAGLVLKEIGESLMRRCSGASGTLYALLFTTVGAELADDATIDLPELARAFRCGLEMVKQVGGASLGDATMVDAIEPFVATLEARDGDDVTMDRVLSTAADAAQRGALSTTELVAKLGRARGFGDRSLGHVDPGARSFAIIAKAWAGQS